MNPGGWIGAVLTGKIKLRVKKKKSSKDAFPCFPVCYYIKLFKTPLMLVEFMSTQSIKEKQCTS